MNFDKHYSTYEKNSLAQKQVAEHLLTHMENADILKRDINSIFEIGCGTGIFTREYRKFFPKSSLILNDIFDVKSFIKDINYNIFIKENIEEIDIPKNHFDISLNYLKIEEIEKIIAKYFQKFKTYKETIKIDFENPLSVLRHLKYTGVTGFQRAPFSKIKSFKDNCLTYEVAYFICQK